ncbi:MAG TPA: PTS sugar transporter subunit IIA [Solirubrobacteraceae bacterium]
MEPLTEHVAARADAADWRAAVRLAGDLLVSAGLATAEYAGAMEEAREELGPYMVIAPGVAMPHARPERGVLAPGVAVVTLVTPVAFGHAANDPVDVVIAFAAEDKSAHLATLQRIAALVTDPDALSAVRGAHDDGELRAALATRRTA